MKILLALLVASSFSLKYEDHKSMSQLNHFKCNTNGDCAQGETCSPTGKGYGLCIPKCNTDSECAVFGTDQKCIPTSKGYGLC